MLLEQLTGIDINDTLQTILVHGLLAFVVLFLLVMCLAQLKINRQQQAMQQTMKSTKRQNYRDQRITAHDRERAERISELSYQARVAEREKERRQQTRQLKRAESRRQTDRRVFGRLFSKN